MGEDDIVRLIQNAEFEEILLEERMLTVLIWINNKSRRRTSLTNRRKQSTVT